MIATDPRLQGSRQPPASVCGRSATLSQGELHRAFRLSKIADRHVLAEIEVEVPASCREHDAAFDGGAPDNLLVNIGSNDCKG